GLADRRGLGVDRWLQAFRSGASLARARDARRPADRGRCANGEGGHLWTEPMEPPHSPVGRSLDRLLLGARRATDATGGRSTTGAQQELDQPTTGAVGETLRVGQGRHGAWVAQPFDGSAVDAVARWQ